MYIPFFLFACYFLSEVSGQAYHTTVTDYFNSDTVRKFRKEWETHRKPLEHALLTSLKENFGTPELNVYIKRMKEKLAVGYFHNDNDVQILFRDLDLEDIPRCEFPDVQLSLASNVLKIQSRLSQIIVHADYMLIRNSSDIIHDPKDQNPSKSSPFLFEQVQAVGRVAITIYSCKLYGYIITTLNGESVNLGYDDLKFVDCQYKIEIYRPGEDSPPVIAKYSLYNEDDLGLTFTHLLMKPLLSEELLPKLQAAMFSFVNTSAIFGSALREYRKNQETVFQETVKYFTELIRMMNSRTVKKNQGALEMEDYVMHWDDGRVKPTAGISGGETIRLRDMVLTGLDTMYSAHLGGPIKLETIIFADEIRFSSLQVRGKLDIKSTWSDSLSFAADISDMVVDVQIIHKKRTEGKYEIKKIEVTGFGYEEQGVKFTHPPYEEGILVLRNLENRHITITIPSRDFRAAESLVEGYLIKEVPKLLRSHVLTIFSELQEEPKTTTLPDITTTVSQSNEIEDFRNPNCGMRSCRLRRYESRKRVADNQIRK